MRRRDWLISSALFCSMAGLARAQSALGVPTSDIQAPTLDDYRAPGWHRRVLIRWGDPVVPGAPPFDPAQLNPSAAARQFGWDAMIAGIITPPPAEDGVDRLILVVAHPGIEARMAFADERDHPRIGGLMQGLSVLNLSYRGGEWVTVDGGYQSRRITDGTLCQITGPAAAVIGRAVQGVLAPQLGCVTPWNSILVPEGHTAPWLRRLAPRDPAFAKSDVGFGFGWVVEIDALRPLSFPKKRTALGRFPRAGLACATAADGTPVVFMTEAGLGGRLFRFKGAPHVTAPTNSSTDSSPSASPHPQASPLPAASPLDNGTLAVAVIEGHDIVWRDLVAAPTSFTATLSAAGQGSRFDDPKGLALDHGGRLYLACAGNRARGIDEVNPLNPRAGHDGGHVIRFEPANGDLGGNRFKGAVVLLGGDPQADPSARYAAGSTVFLRKPATISIDRKGDVLIGTDQGGETTIIADGLYRLSRAEATPDALSLIYRAPIGAAVGASALDPIKNQIFVAVRHPGATPDASFSDPATRWPSLQSQMPPQTTIIALVQTANQ
jgi:secreted PhoX family phosphatase